MIPICILTIESESDREFMTRVFVEYQRLMYATIAKIMPNQWSTEDVLQSTLIKLIDKIEVLKSLSHEQMVNYLIVACRNTAYNQIRYDKNHSSISFEDYIVDDEPSSDSSLVEDQILLHATLNALSNVWHQLDARTQYLLEARYILDKSPEEIALDLGIKPDSTRMALTRARKKAAQLMNGF